MGVIFKNISYNRDFHTATYLPKPATVIKGVPDQHVHFALNICNVEK